jgi:anti-sigma regulatory factor (Ser/Thr protein kinase)
MVMVFPSRWLDDDSATVAPSAGCRIGSPNSSPSTGPHQVSRAAAALRRRSAAVTLRAVDEIGDETAAAGCDADPHPVPRTVRVTAAELRQVRHWVAQAAHRVGLAAERSDRFVLAVNEVVINAIQHGGGAAEVTVTTDERRIVVTVLDHGNGLDRPGRPDLPSPDQTHGRGLWLAHQLCDDVTIHSTAAGTRVSLTAAATRP